MHRRKIIIFGLGRKFAYEKERIENYADSIVAYCDNDSQRWGEKIGESYVISPSEIQQTDFDYIVVTSDSYKEISVQLLSLGVMSEKIIHCNEFFCQEQHGEVYEFSKTEKINNVYPRVLLISVALNFNGGSIAIINAAKALKSRGYNVTVAVPHAEQEIVQELVKWDITVYIAPAIVFPNEREKKWMLTFDIAIVNVFQMIRCACYVSDYMPTMWWIHEPSSKYSNIYGRTISLFYEYAHKERFKKINLLGVSSIACANFNAYFDSVIKEMLPIGIEDTYKKSTFLKKKKVIAVIGSICELKGQKYYVEMAKEFVENSYEFWVIGKTADADYEAMLKEMAFEQKHIKFLGEYTLRDTNRLYKDIDIVVCSSMEETFSLTIVEGMMSEKICITTEQTGVAKYIVDGYNGYICKAGNTKSLSDALRRAISEQDRWDMIRAAARETYLENFTLEKLGENLEIQIRKVCGDKTV